MLVLIFTFSLNFDINPLRISSIIQIVQTDGMERREREKGGKGGVEEKKGTALSTQRRDGGGGQGQGRKRRETRRK